MPASSETQRSASRNLGLPSAPEQGAPNIAGQSLDLGLDEIDDILSNLEMPKAATAQAPAPKPTVPRPTSRDHVPTSRARFAATEFNAPAAGELELLPDFDDDGARLPSVIAQAIPVRHEPRSTETARSVIESELPLAIAPAPFDAREAPRSTAENRRISHSVAPAGLEPSPELPDLGAGLPFLDEDDSDLSPLPSVLAPPPSRRTAADPRAAIGAIPPAPNPVKSHYTAAQSPHRDYAPAESFRNTALDPASVVVGRTDTLPPLPEKSVNAHPGMTEYSLPPLVGMRIDLDYDATEDSDAPPPAPAPPAPEAAPDELEVGLSEMSVAVRNPALLSDPSLLLDEQLLQALSAEQSEHPPAVPTGYASIPSIGAPSVAHVNIPSIGAPPQAGVVAVVPASRGSIPSIGAPSRTIESLPAAPIKQTPPGAPPAQTPTDAYRDKAPSQGFGVGSELTNEAVRADNPLDWSGLDTGNNRAASDSDAPEAIDPLEDLGSASGAAAPAQGRVSLRDDLAWPTGVTPRLEDVFVDDMEVAVVADYGDPPSNWALAPVYAWRVWSRHRQLNVETDAHGASLADAEAERDKLLMQLVEQQRSAIQKDPNLRPLLAPLERLEGSAHNDSDALQQAHKNYRQGSETLQAEIEAVRAQEGQAQHALKASYQQLAAHNKVFRPAEMQYNRLHTELKQLEQDALQAKAQASAPIHSERIAELRKALTELKAPTVAKRDAVKKAERQVLAMESRVAELRQEREAVQQKLVALDRTYTEQFDVRRASVSGAERERLKVLAEVGRKLLTRKGQARIPTEMLSKIRAADESVEQAVVEQRTHLEAYDAFDMKVLKRGVLLAVAGAILLIAVLLKVLFAPDYSDLDEEFENSGLNRGTVTSDASSRG